MKFFSLFILFFVVFFSSCIGTTDTNINSTNAENDSKEYLLPQGFWIGKLRINDVDAIPFNLEVVGDSVYFINADEKIGSVVYQGKNQLIIEMPIFDSEFRFSKNEKGLFGFWYNNAKGPEYKIDFTALPIDPDAVKNRFQVPKSNNFVNIEGDWEADFAVGTLDRYKALGMLTQFNQELTGTFLTETGDYRYLQGNVTGDSMYLSAFDGAHAFLLKAKLEQDTLRGTFFSGTHYQNNWKAFRNNKFELRDADSLTKIKIGKELSFELPGIDGKMVSYPNTSYTGKVVIIQILGSWCPNCMDETKFLTELYNVYRSQGLEVIGISFENPLSLEEKINRVKKLKSYFGAEYQFCIGGDASKEVAESVLPALSNVLSFPTTIIIDRDGKVRRIHTGFSGPGTGKHYLKYVDKTNKFIQTLLQE